MAITNTPNEVVHQAYKSDKRSWFALKHTHLSSYQPGYEHPDLVVPITGNTTVKLNMSRYLQSAPTVTPLFDSMRVNFRVFFAPQRLYTRGLYGNNFEEVDNIEQVQLPILSLENLDENQTAWSIQPGSLLNRLGLPPMCVKGASAAPLDTRYYVRGESASPNWQSRGETLTSINVTPIVAYFDICNHYIANPYVDDIPFMQNQTFASGFSVDDLTEEVVLYPRQSLVNTVLGIKGVMPSNNYDWGGDDISSLAEYFGSSQGGNLVVDPLMFGPVPIVDVMDTEDVFTNHYEFARVCGTYVTSTGLYPANLGEHYQTMFYDEEEINNLNSIVIETDDNGNPTVEGLRLGKSVWNKTLRTILRGRKYTDWIDVQFGSKLKISDHPIFVGSDSMLVSFQDVLNQTAPKSDADPVLGMAAGAGARGGKNADSERTIVFTAQEPGYLMVLVDFVPEVSYSNVMPRWVEYETMSSFPMPAYSGRTFQDLKGSDVMWLGVPEIDNGVIGKQPLYFDYMSSYNRVSGIFGTKLFEPYTFKRFVDLEVFDSQTGVLDGLSSTYLFPTAFDYNFADVGQNGRQNFWMKTEYNLRLYQPLEKQVVTGRI